MHLSAVLPLSLSLVGTALAQAQRSVVSINVAGAAAVATGAPGAQPAGSLAGSSVAPAAAQASVVTIRPQGAGAAAAATGPAGSAASPAGVAGTAGSPAAAQPAGSAASGAAGGAPVWVVKVGSPNNDLIFSPNTVTAKVGEFVQFQFYSKNHSVASSAFETPCAPNTNTPNRAFFAGFMPTEAQGQLTYTVPIKDTDPLWFYCPQAKHCQDGMVGVINPPTSGAQTLQAYQAAAAQAPANVVPNGGQASPASGQPGSNTAPAVAQSTKSAASIVRRVSWELAGAAVIAWLLL